MLKSKQDYIDWMYRLLDPIRPLYTPGCALLEVGDTGTTYDRRTIGMEGFSRPLWALVPYWAGGGRDDEFTRVYREGLAHGSDPAHPEYWGGFHDYDQRFVEMAAIACGMIFTPQVLWEPLAQKDKENLANWLYAINEYFIPDCNWQFFMILVNVALKKHGMKYDAENMAAGLAKVESYYLGDGWYQDGASCQKDYYISFAMHYYGLLYSIAMKDEDPDRCARFVERAEVFAHDFLYWFDKSGAALPYGRSLAYRFGQGAFWAAYMVAGCTGIPADVVKGVLSRHLEWWGAQKMTDRDGVLTIGYAYPNLTMAERYNAPGSPYWGMKSLLILELPDDHPFWQLEPADLPEMPAARPILRADMLVRRYADDTVAYPAGVCEHLGHGHVAEKYAKFAYSTKFGFSCAHSQLAINENAPDSMLAFVPAGSSYVYVRRWSEEYKVENDRVVSRWNPLPGVWVTTTVIPTAEGHLRRHEIDSEVDCEAWECGFAVPKFGEGCIQEAGQGFARVRCAKGGCEVRGEGEGCMVGANPNTNVLCESTEIPAIRYQVKKGHTVLESEVRYI